MNLTGLFRAVVLSVDGFSVPPHRIRVTIPSLTDQYGVWALPCWALPLSAGGRVAPSVGEGVWVMFEGGDINYPVFIGYFGGSDVVSGGSDGSTLQG